LGLKPVNLTFEQAATDGRRGQRPPPSSLLGTPGPVHRPSAARESGRRGRRPGGLEPGHAGLLYAVARGVVASVRQTERFRVAVQNVRDLPALWPYRQRRHLVVACVDDAGSLETLRPRIEGLGATLVVEREPGPLSARLGRPSITVADRFGTIGVTAPQVPSERILAELEAFELSCPECGPQAWGDPGV